MRLVHDDEIEGRRWIQIQKSPDLAALALLSQQKSLVEQRIRNDRARILLRPCPIEVGLLDAVAQGVAVDMGELLVETLEFLHPLALGDQRLRADDQHGLQLTTGLKFLQDEACLDCLAHADLVCD